MLNLILILAAVLAPAQPAADIAPAAELAPVATSAVLTGSGSWTSQPSGTVIVAFPVNGRRFVRVRNSASSTAPLGIKIGGGPTGRQIKTQIPPGATYFMRVYDGETVTLKALGFAGTSDGDWVCV